MFSLSSWRIIGMRNDQVMTNLLSVEQLKDKCDDQMTKSHDMMILVTTEVTTLAEIDCKELDMFWYIACHWQLEQVLNILVYILPAGLFSLVQEVVRSSLVVVKG